ncbi:unnamed protein product [Ectocarpus sp. 13 AM-2016]
MGLWCRFPSELFPLILIYSTTATAVRLELTTSSRSWRKHVVCRRCRCAGGGAHARIYSIRCALSDVRLCVFRGEKIEVTSRDVGCAIAVFAPLLCLVTCIQQQVRLTADSKQSVRCCREGRRRGYIYSPSV